jgi:hypothetical protein
LIGALPSVREQNANREKTFSQKWFFLPERIEEYASARRAWPGQIRLRELVRGYSNVTNANDGIVGARCGGIFSSGASSETGRRWNDCAGVD